MAQAALQEPTLLQDAIDAVYATAGIALRIERKAAKLPGDAKVRLIAPGVKKNFLVEIKAPLTPAMLGPALQRIQQYPLQGLLVADYINPTLANRLKELDVPFMDMTGNIYINEAPVYVYITGNKPKNRGAVITKTTRAFQPTGLKVIFALLCKPELVNAPYRIIAEQTKVANGTIGWVINDLKQLGYLTEIRKQGRRLVEKKRLLERWITTYPEKLRKKITLGHYRPPKEGWWRQAKLPITEVVWGGEVAAAKLTNHLQPETMTLYTRGTVGHLVLQNQLRTDPDGNLEILEAFWPEDCDYMQRELAPPLLVYADLMATGLTRNIETANLLYEQEIIGYLRED